MAKRSIRLDEETHLIDDYLLSFFDQLHPKLSHVAREMTSYVSNSGKSHRFSSINQACGGFHLLPFLFEEEFQSIDINDKRKIALASALGALYVFTEDKAMQFVGDIHLGVLSNMFLYKSIVILSDLFPLDSVFWKYFELYFFEYYDAIIKEKKYYSIKNLYYSKKVYYQLSKGKSALIKVTPCALAVLSGKLNSLVKYNKTLEFFVVALQLTDDVKDWQQDFLNREYSNLLRTVISRYQSQMKTKNLPTLKELKVFIYSSDFIESAIDESNMWFQKAIDAADGISSRSWKQYLETCITNNSKIIEKLLRFKSALLLNLEADKNGKQRIH